MIEFVIVGILRGDIGAECVREGVVNPRLQDVRLQCREVLVGRTEENVVKTFKWGVRPAVDVLRGHAAIDDPVVIDVLIREQKLCMRCRLQRECRIESEALAVEKVAMVVQAFVKTIETKCGLLAEAVIDVTAEKVRAKSVHRCGVTDKVFARARAFRHAIDDAAAAAPTKKKRIGAAKNFDLLKVIERAKNIERRRVSRR